MAGKTPGSTSSCLLRKLACRLDTEIPKEDPFFLARVMADLPRQVPRPPSPRVRGLILAAFYLAGIGLACLVCLWSPPRFVGLLDADLPQRSSHSCFWSPLGEIYDAIAETGVPGDASLRADWALWGLVIGVALLATRGHTPAR